jgi:hypothetical protein
MQPPSPGASLPSSPLPPAPHPAGPYPRAPHPPVPHPPAAGPPAAPGPARPRPPRRRYLAVRAGADRRVLTGALAGGIGCDLAVHGGPSSISLTGLAILVAIAVVCSRRARGWTGRLLIGAGPLLALLLTLRSSPWVTVPVSLAVAGLLVLGASLGGDNGRPAATFPALAARIVLVAGHLVLAPGMFRPWGQPPAGEAIRDRAGALARGALLGGPVMLVVGGLLAAADPIFRSWFDMPLVLQHLALVLLGAWATLGLIRAASAEEPAPALPAAPALGAVEATVVLGGLCVLYAAFVAAQFVALSGAGHRILVTGGLTYAQYARGGFFQLLACAAITLIVLLGVRALAGPARAGLAVASGLTVALTTGVVILAILRLHLYEAQYGLTMLRLACLVTAVWIGVVFVLLGATLPRRGLPRRYFPAALIASALVFVAAWGAANPAAIVARTNLHRAERGRPLDVGQAVSLGPDAVPALLAGLRHLSPARAAELGQAICARPPGSHGGLAFNVSRLLASHALARQCQ